VKSVISLVSYVSGHHNFKLRSGRFLDTPEFAPIHVIGNNENTFNRFDFVPNSKDTLHVNFFVARNWFQVPNSLDNIGQDQRQKVVTFNIAPGYQHTFNPKTLLTINPFVRQDHVNYYPSGDFTLDSPATLSQNRSVLPSLLIQRDDFSKYRSSASTNSVVSIDYAPLWIRIYKRGA